MNKLHVTLYQALDQAVKWHMIPRNPTAAVKTPRPAPKEMQTLSADETRRLLEAARGELGFTAPLVPIEGIRFDGLPPTISKSEGGMAVSQPLPEWPPRGGPGVPEFDVVLGIREIFELIGSRLPPQLRDELQGIGGGVADAPPFVTLTVHLP